MLQPVHDKYLLVGLVIAWITVAGAGAYYINGNVYSSFASSSHDVENFHQEITGFSYRQFERSRLITRLDADKLSIIPRRFLFFSIKSVHEVHIENPRVESHFYDHDMADGSLLPAVVDRISGGKDGKIGNDNYNEFGLITGIMAKGIYVRLFKADRPAIILRAQEGYVDSKKNKHEFINAVLENPAATIRIVSNRIFWDAQAKVFKIPGRYAALADNHKSTGKGIRIDLDFAVSPL